MFKILFYILVFSFLLLEFRYQVIFFRKRHRKVTNMRKRLNGPDFKKYTEAILQNNRIVRGKRDIGYSLTPNSYAVHDYPPIGKKFSVTINNIGIRHPENVDLENYKGKSIILMGDSVSFGVGVDIEDTFYWYIREFCNSKRNNSYDVFNFSVGGYSILDNIGHFFYRKGYSLNPELIIYCYTLKSIFDYPRTNDKVTGFHLEKWPGCFLIRKLNLYYHGNKINYLLNRIGRFIEYCNDNNTRFILIAIPALYKGVTYPQNKNSLDKYTEAVNFQIYFKKKYGQYYYDAFPFFEKPDVSHLYRKTRNGYLNEYEVHLSKAGHKYFANILIDNVIVPNLSVQEKNYSQH